MKLPALPPPARVRTELRDVWTYLRRQGRDPFEGCEPVMVDRGLTPERAQARDAYVRDRLSDCLGDVLAGRLAAPARDDTGFPSWSLHCCVLDRECRELDAPLRLHLTTPWWMLTAGLLPGAGVEPPPAAHRLGPVVVEPRPEHICGRVTALSQHGELLDTFRTCPLRAGHSGGCLDWKHSTRVQRPTLEV